LRNKSSSNALEILKYLIIKYESTHGGELPETQSVITEQAFGFNILTTSQVSEHKNRILTQPLC